MDKKMLELMEKTFIEVKEMNVRLQKVENQMTKIEFDN